MHTDISYCLHLTLAEPSYASLCCPTQDSLLFDRFINTRVVILGPLVFLISLILNMHQQPPSTYLLMTPNAPKTLLLNWILKTFKKI